MQNSNIIEPVIFLVENASALWTWPNYELPEGTVEAYWVAAKCQIDDWVRQLKTLLDTDKTPTNWPLRQQRGGLAEEILTHELLSRVWLAVLQLYEQQRRLSGPASLAQSVFLSHQELRGRVLAALNRTDYLPRSDVQKLLQLCERTDRWADLLLGKLAEWGDVTAFAVEPQRMREFAEDYLRLPPGPRRQQTWKLLKASLQAAYSSRLFRYHPLSEWGRALGGHIYNCFPPQVMESYRSTQTYQESQLLTRCRRAEQLLTMVVPE